MKKIVVLAFIFLAGCNATGPKFIQLESVTPEATSVYLMRQWRSFGAAECRPVSLDGEKAGCLKNGGFMHFLLPPGTHVVKLERRFYETGKEEHIKIEAKGGETIFVEWSISPGAIMVTPTVGVSFSTGVTQLNENQAIKILNELKQS